MAVCDPMNPAVGATCLYAKPQGSEYNIFDATITAVVSGSTINLDYLDNQGHSHSVSNVLHNCAPMAGAWGCDGEDCGDGGNAWSRLSDRRFKRPV